MTPTNCALEGEAIFPAVPHENIRMDRMEVTVRLKQRTYVVDGVFHLSNTGEQTKEWVCLRKHGRAQRWVMAGEQPVFYDFVQFEAWFDGEKAEFTEQRDFPKGLDTAALRPFPMDPDDKRETRWMVKEVTFPGHAETIIRVRYEAPYRYTGGSLPDYGASYYFGAARNWEGRIGKAVFTVDGTDIGAVHAGVIWGFPGAKRSITKCVQRYEIGEFEPCITGSELHVSARHLRPQQLPRGTRERKGGR